MSEAGKGRGRKGGPAEPGPVGSSLGPGGGGSASLIGWIVSANIVALVALVLAVVALFLHPFVDENGEGGAPVVGQLTPTVQPTVPVQPTPTVPAVVEVSVDDDPFTGPEDAAVTIVEFSDYQ